MRICKQQKTILLICMFLLVVLQFREISKSQSKEEHIIQFETLRRKNETFEGNKFIKILSYSLFGRKSWSKYERLLRLAALEVRRSNYYKDWKLRIYHDDIDIREQERYTNEFNNVEFQNVIELSPLELKVINSKFYQVDRKNGMTWRFIAMGDTNTDVMCSRDLDSPLLQREEDAVEYWLNTDKIMHVMRDHLLHKIPILGGMWCFRNYKDRKLGQQILKLLLEEADLRPYGRESRKDNDQSILRTVMWPMIKHDVVQHDSFACESYPGSEPFPTKRIKGGFVGCVRDCEEGEPLVCPKACRPKEHEDWIYC